MELSPVSSLNISARSSGMVSCTSLGIPNRGTMMRIVIAGHNGFAQFLAVCIKKNTPHQLIMLAHTAITESWTDQPLTDLKGQPDLEKQGWQVFATKFTDPELTYLLAGADLVISTVAGSDQIALIEAAVVTGVQRFVPSEFSGLTSLRSLNDPVDNRRREALNKLQQYETQRLLRFTIFSCGFFYERFGPHGLAASQIDMNGSLGNSHFLIKMEDSQVIVPANPSMVYVSMISARDAAQYVVAALALQEWPSEFTFCAQRLSLQDLTDICERVKGVPFQQVGYDMLSLPDWMNHARVTQDKKQEIHFSQMYDVSIGRFDLTTTNLDSLVHVECEGFEHWLRNKWV